MWCHLQVLRTLLCSLCSNGAYNHTNPDQTSSFELLNAEKLNIERCKDDPVAKYAAVSFWCLRTRRVIAICVCVCVLSEQGDVSGSS
jgi:hypothetical protein